VELFAGGHVWLEAKTLEARRRKGERLGVVVVGRPARRTASVRLM